MKKMKSIGFLLALGLLAACGGGTVEKEAGGNVTVVANTVPGTLAVYPAEGPVSGGSTLTVLGSGFTASTTVTVGNNLCTGLSLVSANKVTCTLPAGTPGPKTVVAMTDGAQPLTLTSGFTYNLGPAISLVTPAFGQIAGGLSVTLNGSGFQNGATVTIGGINCPVLSFVSTPAVSLTCRTPVGTYGAKDIVVTNPDAQTTTLSSGFTYVSGLIPTVASLSPNYGQLSGATPITILGSGFISGATVSLGGFACNTVNVVSSTTITCSTPAGTYGAKNVIVTNPDLQAVTVANGFTYSLGMAPTISSIAPSFGPETGATTITIRGSQFMSGATVTVAGITCTSPTLLNAQTLTCVTPAGSFGPKNVIVTNPDLQSITLNNGFSYSSGMALNLSSVTPNFGPETGSTTITLKGAQFLSGIAVTVGGVTCGSVNLVNSNTLTCVTPPGSFGAKPIVLLNPDFQTVTLANAFTFSSGMAPTVSNVTPSYGAETGGTSVTIRGSQFMSGSSVTVGGVSCTSVTYNSSTSLTCVTPAGSFGAKPVVVTNPDAQTVTLANGFTYSNGMAPTISNLSPSYGPETGGTSVVIRGSQFLNGATVTVGGVSCASVTFNSTTSLTCVTPAGSFGAKTVVVTNPDAQSATQANAFTYSSGMAPTISNVTPGYGPETGGTSITIRGSQFVTGVSVTVGGVSCTTLTYNSPTSLTCVTPAGSFGAKPIVVTNPDAQTVTLANAFTYSNGMAPTISNVTPSYGPETGGTAVTIRGSQFVTGVSATVGGVSCASLTFNSATSLTCVTPAGSFGAKSLVVTNPDGQSVTLANAFTYSNGMAPTIASLSVNYGPEGGGTTVVIRGSQFMTGATVTIGGVSCASVTFNSSTSLSCVTPPGSFGAKAVAVTNPDAQTVSLANGFTYSNGMAPTILTVNPPSGTLAGGATITIAGSGFISGATVTLGGISCTNVTVTSATQLTCVTPAGTLGAKSVVVTNPDNQSVTLANGFTYLYVNSQLYSILGAENEARFGYAMVGVGDINGDSIPDFATSEPYAATDGLVGAGKVYVYSGANGALICTLKSPTVLTDGNFGLSLAAGDMNADGKAELVVGEPNASATGPTLKAGRVHVFSGSAINTCASPPLNTALYTLEAAVPQANANFGFSVATGLVSADANYDIVVGEPSHLGAGFGRGRIHTFNGTDGLALYAAAASPTPGDYYHFGFSVTTVDLNGDGRDDIAVGEPGMSVGGSNRGRVYVFNATDGTTQLFTALAGSATNDARFGFSLANGGKINGDSRADLIVGEPFLTSANTNRGRVYVYGYSSGATATTIWSILGPAETDALFGFSVANLGDLDRDGRADFGVGAPLADAGGTDRGRATIFSGSTGISLMTINGAENTAQLGRSMCSIGDTTSDGYPEFLVGEPGANQGGTNRGRVSLFSSP